MAKFATGSSIRTASSPVEKPRLWFYPASLNAAKAHLCLRISSAWPVETRLLNFPEETQSLEYARVNPDMGIPALEIDDKVICGSDLIQTYLTEHYPGPGDQHAPREVVDNFIKVMLLWDEGLWSYKRMPGTMGTWINKLKEMRCHEALLGALERGEENEVLCDGRTVLEAYTKKIAWIRQMQATTGSDGPEVERRIAENDAKLDAMIDLADELLAKSQPFLFGSDLTSADAFLINVLFRCSNIPSDFEKVLQRSDRVRAYWAAVQSTEEAPVVTDYGKNWAFKTMAKNGVPFKLLGLKLGILRVPELPEEVEDGIKAAYKARVHEYYGDKAPSDEGESESGSETSSESNGGTRPLRRKKRCC